MIDDLRVRMATAARTAPLDKRESPDAERFKNIHEWTAYNREKAKIRVQAHHDRGRDATWPKLTGNPEQQIDQAIKVVDRVLLRATQIEYADDPNVGRIVRYRAPADDQTPQGGLPNTGPGVMYNDQGIAHLMDGDRSPAELAKAKAKIAAYQARKQARKAGGAT
jgi:hypothetical protein